MSSEGVSVVGPRSHRFAAWFDHETAAVVTILLGLFQVLLSVLLADSNKSLPKLYILPLAMGIVIVAGGSFTMASERNPSRLLLQGCAYSNVVGLLGTMLAFCLYCYNLSILHKEPCVMPLPDHFRRSPYDCPGEALAAYCWSVTLLLLLYNIGAVVMHSLLSFSALKALKTD
ncbi:uncharacterized protein si:dkey-9i23.16 isoform X1 [Acanthopagrus latus]|uniref:uncharacterized protein si:dkey-9i23.16 isoform X1 n=1 Tax=Acanthopagrus latus TaxID=8177 RepID=UPI00187BF1BC|nr:uncharacterized protein si:dkey-9i23.16 isoform X1 [Acanthopagrus latus]XP_036951078.1 uncharacterized protein si:dkey-9i23.16 isoform X1 [Acanthopagrus latus]